MRDGAMVAVVTTVTVSRVRLNTPPHLRPISSRNDCHITRLPGLSVASPLLFSQRPRPHSLNYTLLLLSAHFSLFLSVSCLKVSKDRHTFLPCLRRKPLPLFSAISPVGLGSPDSHLHPLISRKHAPRGSPGKAPKSQRKVASRRK